MVSDPRLTSQRNQAIFEYMNLVLGKGEKYEYQQWYFIINSAEVFLKGLVHLHIFVMSSRRSR